MQSILFVGDGGERLEINVSAYEHAFAGEYFDDNWLITQVTIKVGGFSGTFGASFLTGELKAFNQQVINLYDSLIGQAKFETLEGQLVLSLTGDSRGHIRLNGTAQDQAGIGNILSFGFTFDQTCLKSSMQDLARVMDKFPVRN